MRTVFRCIALMRTLSHVAQVSSVCLHFHPWSSACALVLECSLHPSLYFFLKSFFHLFLNPAMVPDENSMEDPLCNSSFGSMVSLDYVTPDTSSEDAEFHAANFQMCTRTAAQALGARVWRFYLGGPIRFFWRHVAEDSTRIVWTLGKQTFPMDTADPA